MFIYSNGCFNVEICRKEGNNTNYAYIGIGSFRDFPKVLYPSLSVP